MNTAEIVVTEQKLVCGLTAPQIETLKKKHGFLVIVTVSQGGFELKEKSNYLKIC